MPGAVSQYCRVPDSVRDIFDASGMARSSGNSTTWRSSQPSAAFLIQGTGPGHMHGQNGGFDQPRWQVISLETLVAATASWRGLASCVPQVSLGEHERIGHLASTVALDQSAGPCDAPPVTSGSAGTKAHLRAEVPVTALPAPHAWQSRTEQQGSKVWAASATAVDSVPVFCPRTRRLRRSPAGLHRMWCAQTPAVADTFNR